MYKFDINPNKWVDLGDLQLEQNKPYWFKKKDGQIVMGSPSSNGHSSGVADVYLDANGLRIKGNSFHILRGCQVQEVILADV